MKDLRILPKFRDSFSYLYIEHGVIEQDDKSISVFDTTGRVQIPVASLSLLLLGPGTTISHAAVRTTIEVGCLIVWSGEESVRFYASGNAETRNSNGIIRQAILFANNESRIQIAKKMYHIRFPENLSEDLTIEQLRGKEGVRVRAIYAAEAEKHKIPWSGRSYDRRNWDKGSDLDKALSVANSCLYGVCHSAIVALGYSPALGFIHTGKQLSFVYDIADLYKAKLTIPIAFEMVANKTNDLGRTVRLRLRDEFKNQKILSRIVEDIQDLMGNDDPDDSGFDSDPAKPGYLAGENSVIEGGKNHGRNHS